MFRNSFYVGVGRNLLGWLPYAHAVSGDQARGNSGLGPSAAFEQATRDQKAIGTFSEYSTISENSAIKVDSDLPLDKVVLIGCGVPTGFGSAVHAAASAPRGHAQSK